MYVIFLLVMLYATSLLLTILAFRGFFGFLQGQRREVLTANEDLRKRNALILSENKKVQEENKVLGREVGQVQNLYEIIREIGVTLEFESTFQIFSQKLTEMFFFRRVELILLEEKDGQMVIKRILEIAGREVPPFTPPSSLPRPPLKSPLTPPFTKRGLGLNPPLTPPFNKGGLGGIKACPALDAGVRGQAEKESSSQGENIVNLFAGGGRGAIFIPDASQSLRARRLSLPREVKSFAAIPLMMEKEMLAVMTIENIREDDFDRFSVVAAQLALAIKKARLYQKVQELSIVDGLTGTFLRRYFLEQFEEELQRSRHQRLPLAFLMADIDHFKEYNDKYGHLVGDAVLKDVAHLLKEGVREIDLVGRYGGEEFSLLLAETNRESALQVAERLRLSVEEHRLKADDEAGQATISLGLATFPEDAQETESLIDKADMALYKAKQCGRNRVC